MKLFVINIEHDEIVLVTAANPEEALESIGLSANLLLQPENSGDAKDASLPQHYKVIELNNLHLRFRCTRSGDLNLYDADQHSYEWLFALHPEIKLQAMRE